MPTEAVPRRALEAARRLAAGAVVLAVAVLAGCGGGGGGAEPGPKEIVAATAEKTAAVASFRFTLEVTSVPPSTTGLSLTRADGEVVVPDRLDAEISGSFARLPISSELVIVGGDDYFKDPLSGRWRTLDIRTSPVALFDPHQGVLAIVRGARDVALVGKEAVAGVDTYRLTGKVVAREASPLLAVAATSDRLVDVDLWVGVKDMILRRVRVSGPVAAGEPERASRTVELSDFGAKFRIERPEVTG